MRITLHLYAPNGEAKRRLLNKLLRIVQDDNRLVINGLMNSGLPVADTMSDLGLTYKPPGAEEANTPDQGFFGVVDLVERGTFSCGDAAAWEAAVLEEKYGIPAEAQIVAQGATDYHAIVITPNGVYDPTEAWIEAQGGRAASMTQGADRAAGRLGMSSQGYGGGRP